MMYGPRVKIKLRPAFSFVASHAFLVPRSGLLIAITRKLLVIS